MKLTSMEELKNKTAAGGIDLSDPKNITIDTSKDEYFKVIAQNAQKGMTFLSDEARHLDLVYREVNGMHENL